jgi:integrase
VPRARRKRSYGSGSIRYLPGGRAEIRWRDGTGKQRSQTVAAGLAERALAVRQGDLARVEAWVERDPRTVASLAVLAADFFSGREGPNNRNNDSERRKWENHLKPELGHLRPDQVTTPLLRAIIKDKLARGRLRNNGRWKQDERAGLSSTTVLQLMRILSTLYTRLIEDGAANNNPVRALPKDLKKELKPGYDWRNTPFLARLEDARRIFAALWEESERIAIAFAIGISRGPRPGELRALFWTCVDLETRLLHIRHTVSKGRLGPPKSGRSRALTISPELHGTLIPWRLRHPGNGLVLPPRRRGVKIRFMSERAMNDALRPILVKLGLPPLTWYEATRHTFASHFVLRGGSLEKLAAILGHSTVTVTERYAHLRPDALSDEDTGRAQVDLLPGTVVALPPQRRRRARAAGRHREHGAI